MCDNRATAHRGRSLWSSGYLVYNSRNADDVIKASLPLQLHASFLRLSTLTSRPRYYDVWVRFGALSSLESTFGLSQVSRHGLHLKFEDAY